MKIQLAMMAALSTLLASAVPATEITGRGDFTFHLDTAAFLGKGGRVMEEIYIRVSNSELKFLETEGALRSRVKVYLQVTTLDGTPVVKNTREMEFVEKDPAVTASLLYGQTIVERINVDPGEYELSYAIEDLLATRRTMTGMLSRSNRSASVRRLRINLPNISTEDPSFSDAKFVWSVDRVGDRIEYQPNPAHLYGLYRDSLMVYMELYLPDTLATAKEFEFQSIVTAADGTPIAERALTLRNPGDAYGNGTVRAYPVVINEDLSKYTAGVYTLYVSFGIDGRTLRRVRCGRFSVAWDMRTWEVPRREYMAEARFLLGDDEFKKFVNKETGDQELALDVLWRGFDPTPETAENEAYEEFLVRLAYVRSHYAEDGDVIFTSRGKVYIRYGPPEELVIDVVPINRETVSEALAAIEDAYHPINMSSQSVKLSGTPAARSNIVDPRKLSGEREGDNAAFPFELWIYHGGGDPILDRDRVHELAIGARYLFVDREGYGRYRLESSSANTNK